MRAGKQIRGVFVTGTDTGIGKTIVAACLVRRWQADYWKPVQTGVAEEEDDSAIIARLAAVPLSRIHPPCFTFAAALSPQAAGALEGVQPSLADFCLPSSASPIVVEGAGGVLVPLGPGASMADLIGLFGLPAILVARSTLGTINHTRLTAEALRHRGIAMLGVVLVGPCNPGNRAAIETLAGLPVLAELPVLDAVTPDAIAAASLRFPSSLPLAGVA